MKRATTLGRPDVDQLVQGQHPDPFGVLGPHADETGAVWLRAFVPGASAVQLLRKRRAARSLVADGLAEEGNFLWDGDGYKPVTTEFIDGLAYDGHAPNAYLDQFTIGLNGDEQPNG